MNILIDIGNSRLKWTLQQAARFEPQPEIAYRQENYLQLLTQCWLKLPMPEKLAISCVADPAVRAEVMTLAGQLWPDVAMVLPVATACGFGVKNAYPQPEKLGVDRWLNLLAAHRYYPGQSCIVDCGTAITLDVLAADGQHQGGLICPGLQLMKKALTANTAALAFSDQPQPLGLADNTAAAIDSGSRYAALGMIETVLGRQAPPCQLILCGGDAPALSTQIAYPHVVDSDLIFKGLAIIL